MKVLIIIFISIVVFSLIVTEIKEELRKEKRKKDKDKSRGSEPVVIHKPSLTLAMISKFNYLIISFSYIESDGKTSKVINDVNYYKQCFFTIKTYLDSFLLGDYEKEHEETILLYLICLVGKRQFNRIYDCYIDDLTNILKYKYNMVIPNRYLLSYKIKPCWGVNEPTHNIFMIDNDCINEYEYRAVYSYYLQYINTKHLLAGYKVILTLFLLRSRFAGRFGHKKLKGIDYDAIILDFVKYAEYAKANHSAFFMKYTDNSISYLEFINIYKSFEAKACKIKNGRTYNLQSKTYQG